jgi:hypothetical protein
MARFAHRAASSGLPSVRAPIDHHHRQIAIAARESEAAHFTDHARPRICHTARERPPDSRNHGNPSSLTQWCNSEIRECVVNVFVAAFVQTEEPREAVGVKEEGDHLLDK